MDRCIDPSIRTLYILDDDRVRDSVFDPVRTGPGARAPPVLRSRWREGHEAQDPSPCTTRRLLTTVPRVPYI